MTSTNFMKSAVISCCFLTLAGCGSKESAKSGQEIARVNGNVITDAEMRREVANLPPYLKNIAETDQGKKELLDTMVVREIILEQAEKSGLAKSKEVQEKVEDLKKKVIVEAFLKKKIEERAVVSDADLQQFYEKNKDKLKTGEQIRASHILVKSEKEAQDILAQLKAGGKFEDLAQKHSIDGAASRGGDLGWFGKGTMVPEFEKTATALPEGGTSGVVKTQFGYHIIKLTGKRPAGVAPLADVKEQLKGAILAEKQGEIFKQLKEELKKNAKVQIKEDALKKVVIKSAEGQGEGVQFGK